MFNVFDSAAYNKAVIPPGARIKGRARDTWLLIGSVIAALVLIMVLFCLLAIGLSKNKRRKNSGRTTENKQQVFEVEAGSCNFAYEEDSDVKVITAQLTESIKIFKQILILNY